jgi:hypothetical protein
MRRQSLVIAATFIASSAAIAHMKAAKTLPAEGDTLSKAPTFVQVWFSQKPDEAVSAVTLTGPRGDVSLFVHPAEENSLMGMIQDEKLSDGVYVVKWRAAGDDGHIQKGEFRFTLKASD